MDELGPLFKNKASEIKKILENMDVKKDTKISIKIDEEIIEIPKKCYKIIEKNEKQSGEKFVPHVIEPSYGIDRILYCLLEHNYIEKKKKNEEYRILKLNPIISPIKVGVLPLINDEKLIKIAKEIDLILRDSGVETYYDDKGTIGRRYARMDEIGTPYCITIDFDTLKDKSITIRDRNTSNQERVKIKNIENDIIKKLK